MAANPSTANAHQVLIQELLNNLPAGYTAAKVKLPNRHFTTPNSSKWLRPTVINQTARNVQSGGLWKRYEGLMVIDTFYPIGSDDIAQLSEAETIAAIFENKIIGGVNCYDVLISVNTAEEVWYNVQIEIDFMYEGLN